MAEVGFDPFSTNENVPCRQVVGKVSDWACWSRGAGEVEACSHLGLLGLCWGETGYLGAGGNMHAGAYGIWLMVTMEN